jgi:hypothetical protein
LHPDVNHPKFYQNIVVVKNSLFTNLQEKLPALKAALSTFISSSSEMWYGSGISQNGFESVGGCGYQLQCHNNPSFRQ